VQVKAEPGEEIASVRTTYDDSELADDDLSPNEVQYQRIFKQIGGYTPGDTHTVQVTATNNSGKSQTSTRTWTD
jgi:hypothetical protein